ncbi:ATP-binding protein [Methylobacterium oxalidis]|uniref:Sensory/regulatory protein RpfC n=1 Tax=Methylobacterium oxalidis TaxID=944322 RepID=A0A512J0R5_9HYPH|nr:ATP-binding protein [Methylobacterium oxalidis]GEP03570.1 hybrid sensor histidine kinase/response regulator [Methylobacterium oxalidis]GJE33094.1 Sensor histidine kinase RcsC [Methylobacterium oxalidis]GLS66511.1 hybrid sensor histidine kinase/response regulator [Methylobacterium oxalidis]
MDLKDIALVLALLAAGFSLAALVWRGRPSCREEPGLEDLHDRIWRISESEERYRALVEATMEVIVQRDALGRVTFANDGFARLLGRAPLDLIGATLDLELLEQGPVGRGPDGVRRLEARVLPVDGQPRWFSFVEMPVARADGPVQWLRAGYDITARVEAARSLDGALARAEAANVAKSRFLATVSHEFRTPLNGILGMADLVLDTGLDPEQRTYVESVRTSGKALLTLIDGILDFSRIEAGRLDLAAEPFDIAALTEGVVELLAPRAQDKGIEIALDVADDLNPRVIGDADRVRQILINLAGNAIKFTERGGVGVTLTRAGEGLALAIADTGPGIPEDRIPLLFEEFEQGDGSASRPHEGTGLGLAITRRLVARMGGRIETVSKVGRGSTFRVVLPLPEAEEAEPPAGVILDDRRILIVADSPFQAPYLARRLSRSGAAAVTVASVEAGLDALAGAGFDALIADRALGDAAVRRLADEARRCGVRCSLILLSPFDRREFGAPHAAGFDSYLIKPVRARSLFDRLLAPAPPIDAGPNAAPREAAGPRCGARVLLAEDNPINALLAGKALERLGASVVLARDGVEALARLAEAGETRAPFDLALIDIRMPGLDGLETARRIRAAEAASGGPPLHLVALTANAGREDERAARAAGFDGFLAKPLNLKALPGLLERRAA